MFNHHLNSGSVYCDIGAWIGPTVMLAASRCKTVYCFEPDTVAYENLLCNIRLNALRNVIPFNLAVSSFSGLCQMSSFGGALGDTMTSVLKSEKHGDVINVPAMTWDLIVDTFKLGKIDFIKMDVEGAEFELLPSMQPYLSKNLPTLYLSTHAPYLKLEERRSKLALLLEALNAYNKCYDSNLVQVDKSIIVSEQSVSQFSAYLFTK